MKLYFQTLSNQIKHTLQQKFSDRVSFDSIECRLYSHDLASPPALIKSLISRRIAEGVVQPQDENELTYLLRLAGQRRIPLTPWGRGTSGYGGAIPRFGGLVVDFSRMNSILKIDQQNLTATTGPGVIWSDLERELESRGLSLRLYPGSAPISTVAGWLAQGGSGFGSYAYGWFGENVVSVRLVRPDGRVVTYAEDNLDFVRDVEGITGFISEVTLKVKPAEPLDIVTASFKLPEQLTDMLERVVELKLKLWSVSFINPFMAELRDKLRRPERAYISNVISTYLVSFVFPKSAPKLKALLKQMINDYKGRLLKQELADKLWDGRFELLKIKKIAPSLISTKVAIPLGSLGAALRESRKIKQPLAIEGVLLQDRKKTAKAVLLGFIPHDERKASYNLSYALALSFIKLTGRAGGLPCASGIYFKHQAARIIGAERMTRLIQQKKLVDPQHILNPGKVITNGYPNDLIDRFMKAAWRFELPIRLLNNRINYPLGTGARNNIAWYAYCCDQCGFCLKGCPNFSGWESQAPRGWWYLMRLVLQKKLKLEEIVHKFQYCSACGECKISCPQGLSPVKLMELSHKDLTSRQSRRIIK